MHSKKRNCSVFKAYFDIDENKGNLASVMRLLHTQRMDLNTVVSFDSNFLKLMKTISNEREEEDHQMIDRFLSRGDIVFRTIDPPEAFRPATTRTHAVDKWDDGTDCYDYSTSSSSSSDNKENHSIKEEEDSVVTDSESETENEWEAVRDRVFAIKSPDAKMIDGLIRGVLQKVTGNESDDDDCGVEQLLNEAMKMAGEKMLASLDNNDAKKEA
jgi:hypothetical protein